MLDFFWAGQVVRGSGWTLSEVESLSLEGEGISSLGDSFGGAGRLVYLNLAKNNLSSLLVSATFSCSQEQKTDIFICLTSLAIRQSTEPMAFVRSFGALNRHIAPRGRLEGAEHGVVLRLASQIKWGMIVPRVPTSPLQSRLSTRKKNIVEVS